MALAAADEAELLALERDLVVADVPHVAIREPDPPFHNAMTAIGIRPVADRKQVRRILGGLPLLR